MFSKSFLFLAAALAAQSATIVSVGGPVNFSGSVGSSQVQTAAFSTSQAYTNVSISAFISGPSAQTFNAYLTSSIGPGTTVANQVATATENFPGFSPGTLTPVFTGLNLAANTYYLTLFNPATTNGAWSSTNAPVIGATPGAAYVFSGYFITNGDPLPYPPAAAFGSLSPQALIFTVATANVAEPATVRFGLLALLITVAVGRRMKGTFFSECL